jgi:hypothetical protein
MGKTKFAIGCLVQWYEVDIIGEYIETLEESITHYNGDVIVDFTICVNQTLEKCVSEKKLGECLRQIENILINNGLIDGVTVSHDLETIADYRREFNDKYCEEVDVLVWGESDMLVPKQMFETLDMLHQSTKDDTPKYLATFGCCKMWDSSWKPLEHVDFTDKPFIEGNDAIDKWWSLRYNMSKQEMNDINSKVDELQVTTIAPHKYNGCGLVISSEVIKSGVNIPRSVFFVHEDTAFMYMTQKVLGNIPQYHFSNILLVHNRKHPNKRAYIKGEEEIAGSDVGAKRKTHDWYTTANKMCESNCNNLFNPKYKPFTWQDVWNQK